MNDIYTNQLLRREESNSLFTRFVNDIDASKRTKQNYVNGIKQFRAWLYYADVTEPKKQDIANYKEWLESEHDAIQLDLSCISGWSFRIDRAGNRLTIKCRVSTVFQYIRVVKHLFKWAANNGLYPNIAAEIKTPKLGKSHSKEALNIIDVPKIENSIMRTGEKKEFEQSEMIKDRAGRIQRAGEQTKRLYAMYLLAVNAGLRTVEISRANIKDFESKGGKAWLYIHGKGHGEADTKKPITPEIAQALNEYIKSRSDSPTGASPLFVATGNRHGGKRLQPSTIGKMLKKAMVDAGFNSDKLTAHSLRHTTGTAVMEVTNKNIYMTQMYMRHENPKTTEIYLHSDNEKDEADTAQALYNLFHGIKPDTRTRLETIIDKMTPKQLEQLTGIAESMA